LLAVHHQGIIHRDIKPANLLWSADHSVVKITDFGVSHHSNALARAAAEADAAAAAAASATSANGTESLAPASSSEEGYGSSDRASAKSKRPVDEGVLSPVSVASTGGFTTGTLSSALYDREDETELAKTAGSPAFFAPELCYGGETTPIATTPLGSPPAGDDASFDRAAAAAAGTSGTSFFARRFTSSSGGSGNGGRPSLSHRGSSSRPQSCSSATAQPFAAAAAGSGPGSSGHQTPSPHPSLAVRRPRITKAIDIWALGVTLYCLLFARVPFEAHSEFALFGVIPFDDYRVPESAGADELRTGNRAWDANEEARELGDLMDRLLEKDPEKRIRLEEVKVRIHSTALPQSCAPPTDALLPTTNRI